MTTEEFIARAKEVHGDKYDYSKVKYVNARTKVTIICREHNYEFEQVPDKHLHGQGCPICAGKEKITTELFIKRANEVHNGKYDYSKSVYKNNSTYVTIICPEHGEFQQTPAAHWKGAGCPFCAGNLKMTKDEFITRAKKVHDDAYDYSKVDYSGIDNKVKIVCRKHNYEFEQTPNNHLHGQGCPICRNQKIGDKLRGNTEDFIAKAMEVHGDKYDYSKVKYKKANEKVTIICRKHNYEFEQTPNSHLGGCGCPICNKGYTKQYKFNLLEEFENEYAFRAFLDDNIDILPLIFMSIGPKYEPIKRDIERALAHASETNPIQSLREKYSSDSNESDDDDELIYDIDTDDTVDDVVDWDDDDIVNEMISQESQFDNEEELSIDDVIRKNNNYEEEIRVLNRLDSEHLITPEVREGIMSKILNNKIRAWMAKRDNK